MCVSFILVIDHMKMTIMILADKQSKVAHTLTLTLTPPHTHTHTSPFADELDLCRNI